MDTVTYAYEDTQGWGDLLTAYDGQTITYDTIGNPLTDGTWTYTWDHGRRLESMSDGTDTWQFSYNADGLRTKRESDSHTYTYRYDGDQLRIMSVDNVHMSFVYNADGPMAISYSGTTYYYTKNLQGDITGLVDANGNSVVEYTYDAWGNVLSTTGSLKNTLGAHNPLRYRGYVYDSETRLYYLQSRYYNPETGRFINADGFVSTGQGILGNNMFAYCLNNPIIHSDPSGEITLEVILEVVKKMAISGAINLATSYGAALITNQKFSFRDGIAAFVAGAGSGISPFLGGTIGGLYAAFSCYENGADIGEIILSGLAAFACNAFSLGGLSKHLEGLAMVFVETVFTTGSNLLSAGIYKGIQNNIGEDNNVPSQSPRYSTPFTPYSRSA